MKVQVGSNTYDALPKDTAVFGNFFFDLSSSLLYFALPTHQLALITKKSSIDFFTSLIALGSTAKVIYNWKSRLAISSDYKIHFTWVEAGNPSKVLAKLTIRYKKLYRGETQVLIMKLLLHSPLTEYISFRQKSQDLWTPWVGLILN
jgi:hypothetical protein